MATFAKAYLDAQAYRWLRPDWRRYVQRGSELEQLYERLEQKYRPDQARVPAGESGGGQWTDDGGSNAGREAGSPSGAQENPKQYAQVIRICTAGVRSLATDYLGNKSYMVVYDCAGGRSNTRRGVGHSFPGIIIDRF